MQTFAVPVAGSIAAAEILYNAIVAVAVLVTVQSTFNPLDVADVNEAAHVSPTTAPATAISVDVTYPPVNAPDDATEPGFHATEAQPTLDRDSPP